MTHYLRSPLAHNTYTLDGAFVGEHSRPDLDVDLIEAVERRDLITLKGRSERFTSPATFERTIEVADYSTVKVRDVLTGDGSWEGRLQLPGDLDVAVGDRVVTARDPDGRETTITFAADTELEFITCHGDEDPICGWGNLAHEFGPATTLIWSFENAAEISFDIGWSGGS